MERLTTYSYGEILILVLLASLVLIAQSAALCWALAHLPRRRIRYLLPEAAALSVVLLTTLLLGGAWKLFFAELPPIGCSQRSGGQRGSSPSSSGSPPASADCSLRSYSHLRVSARCR